MSTHSHTESPLRFRLSSLRTVKRAAGMVLGAVALALPVCAFADNSIPNSTPLPSLDLATLFQWSHHDSSAPDFSTDARNRYPFFISAGVYFPTFTGDGTNNNVGGELSLGYRYAIDSADLRVSLRGQEYGISDYYGDNATISVGMIGLDAFYRIQQFYVGPGLSFGSVSGSANGYTVSGQDATLFEVTAGYDFTQRVFGEVRWQTADVDAYKGWSIDVGLRF